MSDECIDTVIARANLPAASLSYAFLRPLGGALARVRPGEMAHRGGYREDVASIKDEAKTKFDRWSGSYERDWRSRFNSRAQDRALDALALAPADRFLDVGCGTGAAVRRAAGTVERAVGVDLSDGMIGRARALAGDAAGAEFVVGDSERLPFRDGSFSAILCTASFHHYADPDGALAEMARVLVAGGRLVLADGTADLRAARIVDWFMRRVDRSHVRLYRTAELLAMLGRAGFVEPEVEHLWDGGYAIVKVAVVK